ncbi:hypothetical protein, conserved [Trypanosoma brucei brucei TREU927]|uniref:Uncharacterized protein n=1 Tax=Trypanosoma brucei brucei (strain 927/4 GUTat10.1) TaxID=185431 RepID=Q386L3_TRYB2|nr:hypothetical protein, conserved [Trypanosoma brucei brucei TREU927]EAN79268.1 hypothetical protein, conserved [Trypanosoma brucei brucei TREU927]
MGDFALISMNGDRVFISLDPVFTSQSLWLQAAEGLGEREGVVPIASTETLHNLVEYMAFQAKRMAGVAEGECKGGQTVTLPISCTTCSGSGGLGYDVHSLLPDHDIAFLDRFGGTGGVWEVEQQEKLMELMATADFVGHGRLSRLCAVYISCRLMSATESDILSWFSVCGDRCGGVASADPEADDGNRAGERVLRDAERLRILNQMRKYIEIED